VVSKPLPMKTAIGLWLGRRHNCTCGVQKKL
jgi:hypothetical protein